MPVTNIAGMRFGRLIALERSHNPSRSSYWCCRCDCGKTTIVRGSNLRRGKTKSCGCLHNELSSLRLSNQNCKHGESQTRLYGIWCDMKKRCNNPNHWAYSRYGGRGIDFDLVWETFEPFKIWAEGNGYADNLTLDREDNDGPYSPTNCRWVTRKTQSRNRTTNILYEYCGEKLTLAEWAERYGFSYSTLYGRIHNYGWPVERALTTPPRRRGD